MWERFSYYGMRALLILYLVNFLEFPREHALEIYATYTALIYLTPIVGGYLGDKWLGPQRAVLVGGIVMALGHFAMAFPSLLYLGLGLLIAGNGFFKPNISVLVGSLYRNNDPRQDGGFTLFYMGINLGGFLSPLVCGTLSEIFGWHYGFAAAGVGMIIGMTVFIGGQKSLVCADSVTAESRSMAMLLTRVDWFIISSISLIVIIVVIAILAIWDIVGSFWSTLSTLNKTNFSLLIAITFIVLFFVLNQSQKNPSSDESLTRIEFQRIMAIFIMGLFAIFFWMGLEQAGGTMNLFADTETDRQVFGWEIPTSYFQSINSLAILLFAPILSIFWIHLDRSRFAISSMTKQGIGLTIMGLGFVVLAIAQERANIIGQVSPFWLVAVYLIHTIGELCLSPIGLSMVIKLAPARLVSLLMGFWFTAVAIGSYLAGMLESFLNNSSLSLYWFLVGSSIGAGLLLLLITPLIHRLIRDAT